MFFELFRTLAEDTEEDSTNGSCETLDLVLVAQKFSLTFTAINDEQVELTRKQIWK